MIDFLRLLLGTVIYRPYVYGFFACFLFFSLKRFKPAQLISYFVISYLTAYASEYSATRNGFPFGVYTYIDATRTRELWLSNIPFWDSLSFVFLSYFSWIVAASTRKPGAPREALLDWQTAILGGFLMMLLDVVIDPLSLLGDRWFLGKLYYYPYGGQYFGVTLTNFAGWFFVGASTLAIFQALARRLQWSFPELGPMETWGCFGVYAGVLAFNLAITGWIGAWTLFLASGILTCATLGFVSKRILCKTKVRS
ncbi:MAG: carotenoid biosynthesis protein [Oligoflexia bacterium]|nr:carotenoid biosynthesis protein [Oligoflexia bacterium]